MKKKFVHLQRKLLLQRSVVAALNSSAQQQLNGGITGSICPACPGVTLITECRPTSPSPQQRCYNCV
ncbi:MAG TPA: class I lanthipeptide [Chitinophaga sp.]|uniref:class I lanthipeptide n=1 Tax=Chitinophaga sp. TaxID=1869181 RepID=UPI002BF9B991|nr:class I lanthipeptide [Chitinophaga sp.]HVI44509.1 class I lanthipeptide [Chitinophaga sp.]